MTKVYRENGAINRVNEILSIENPSSILLITGNESYWSSGAWKMIEPHISKYGFIQMSGFSKLVSQEDVERVVSVINSGVDFIMAVGGGSVMDVAKAASVLHGENGCLNDYITKELGLKGRNIKRLFIPTTTTGVEIIPRSTVYLGKTKYSLNHPSMSPDYVVLLPELTYSLNPKVTAESGCDALAQAIEGFWSIDATEESKEYSREAIPLLIDNLNGAVNNPNPENREAMLIGAHLSGKAMITANTTAAHSISYPLTSFHGISHGHAVMLTLPYFFPINGEATTLNIQDNVELGYVRETFNELLSILDVKNSKEAKEKLLSLTDDIGLERNLRKLGVKEDDLQNIVDNSFTPNRINKNPVKITSEIVWGILRSLV